MDELTRSMKEAFRRYSTTAFSTVTLLDQHGNERGFIKIPLYKATVNLGLVEYLLDMDIVSDANSLIYINVKRTDSPNYITAFSAILKLEYEDEPEEEIPKSEIHPKFRK